MPYILKNLYLIRVVVCVFALVTYFSPICAFAKPLQNQMAIDSFYLQRSGEPLWVKSSALNRSGQGLLGVLRQSWMNGLNPNSYNVEKIERLVNTRWRFNDDQAIDVEILLTDGYVRYVQDLSGMRIKARDMKLNPAHWRQRISAEEALSLLPEHQGDIVEFLLMREPQGATYQRLKAELVILLEGYDFSSEANNEPLIFKTLVLPGRGYNDVPKLRARLGLGNVNTQDRHMYDPELVDAVIAFQSEKDLKADGVIGRQTLDALNQTSLDSIYKLIVNMERLRWVPDEKPERFIVVNIPSATLWAIDDGSVVFEMPVVVGRKKRPTASFVTYVHGVRFNPTWTVPETIKEEDIWPQLIVNPEYLSDKGMELFDGHGKDAQTLDPLVIDWAEITQDELHSLRMVQIPGDHNPLGRIRILMPNEHNIYLHDTNHKELFARSNRAQSSGCVRLHDPKKMALFVLEKRKGWSDANMQKALESGALKNVYTDERMTVYFMYYTTWLGDKNQIVYGFDLYGNDKTLLQLIEKLDEFHIIRDNNIKITQVVD